jgi:hypothetical protein
MYSCSMVGLSDRSTHRLLSLHELRNLPTPHCTTRHHLSTYVAENKGGQTSFANRSGNQPDELFQKLVFVKYAGIEY